MQCDICDKDYKNIKAHKRLAHPGADRDIEQEPVVIELRQQVAKLVEALEELDQGKKASKSVEDIARILYEDVAKAICDSNGIPLGEWGSFDPADYLAAARKIKG